MFYKEGVGDVAVDLTPAQKRAIKEQRATRGLDDNKVLGEKIDDGVVVSDSYARKHLDGESDKTLEELRAMDEEDIVKLSGRSEGTTELRRGIDQPKPLNFQAHHVVPRELRDKYGDFFDDIGFNIEDGTVNGIMMPPKQSVLDTAKLNPEIPIGTQFDDYAFHLGSHPDYTRRIKDKIEVGQNEAYKKNRISKEHEA